MALINCPECGKEVSDKAETCPNCGYSIKKYMEDIENAKKKEKEEKELKERQEILQKEKEDRENKIKEYKDRLFGTKSKKIIWSLLSILVIIVICIGIFLYNSYMRDILECEKDATTFMEEFEKVDGHLLDKTTIGNDSYYDVDYICLILMQDYWSFTNKKYNALNDKQKQNFDNWFRTHYNMTLQEVEAKLHEYGLGTSILSSDEMKQFLSDYRRAAEEEEAKKVEIVEQSLTADGDYYDYVGKIKNNTNSTITYIKYTIYIYDEDYNLIDSDWSNWTGTLKPDATIMVDTMVRRYDRETKSYEVVIDEYH